MIRYSTLRRVVATALLAVLSLSASGCFLFTLSGAASMIDGSLIISANTDSMLTTCIDPLEPSANVECTYTFLGESGIPVATTSSAQLISEFGILGVIIDPLIVQVPVGASNIVATYDDGGSNVGDLDVLNGYKSIPVDFNRHLIAEPGTQFIIAELPDGVPFDGIQYAFGLNFQLPPTTKLPIQIKPLLSSKFEDGFGNVVFYSPLLPCTTDMAQVASFTIGASAKPVDIPISSAPVGCNGEQYAYLGFGATPCDFDQDQNVDLDDLIIQARARNAPALPGDRMDANADGLIDLNDVRRCALQCTTVGCPSESVSKSTRAGAVLQGDAS